mgnify:CR=1 FL=1
MIRIAVPKENAAREARVALVPESVAKLVKSGATVSVEHDAGLAAGFTDANYVTAGATIAVDFASVVTDATLVCKVQPPTASEVAALPAAATLICYLAQSGSAETIAALAGRTVNALALEKVPRITRAQSMDVLSSQATVSGYKAVLIGAGLLPKMLPMLTTAAGTLAPAKVFVIGAGVAGLAAIGTASGLGAIVRAALEDAGLPGDAVQIVFVEPVHTPLGNLLNGYRLDDTCMTDVAALSGGDSWLSQAWRDYKALPDAPLLAKFGAMAFLALAIALAAVLAGWVARGNAWMGAHEGLAWGALGVATVAACVSGSCSRSEQREEAPEIFAPESYLIRTYGLLPGERK